MRALLVAVVFGVAVVPHAAHAQIPGALGQPLASPDLPAGTVSVRVIAGAVSSPVAGTDVTLVVNGTPRVARTDSAGRATFKDLPTGAKVQAKVTDEDKKDVTSSEFPLPEENGVRVMLTTKPFQGGAGGAPFAGGGAMPEPRQMSGEPRPEQADSPGSYTVRLTYDDFKDAPPVGVLVALVAFHADDSVDLREALTDQDGRASFLSLDRTGATSYFAMAQLPRGDGVDRMISTPSVLDTRAGARLVLSAEKRTSTAPAVDDITRIEKQEHAPAAGKVRVSLQGVPDVSEVQLVALRPSAPATNVKIDDSAVTSVRRIVAHIVPTRSVPDPSDILAQSQFQPKPDVPAHTVQIQVHGGAGVNEPIVGATIRLVPAKPVGPVPEGGTVKTPTDGYVELTDPSDGPLIAEININGKAMKSQPFDLSKSNSTCRNPCGGYLDVEAQWEAQGKLEAELDASDVKPDEVVFAETKMRGVTYRSIPFQPIGSAAGARGTSVTLYIYPRILFSFSLTSHIDDAFLAVSGRFDVSNNSWAPYIGGTDGLVIPLPKHFKGAVIAEQDQGDVAVAQGDGFRIGRPIPPGGKQFHAGFSLPVDNGKVEWSLDLPLGAFQSGMEIQQTPGMSVQLPPSVQGKTMTVPQGTFFVLPQISILPKQSMNMTIIGLPSPPAWRTWAPRIVGILAVMIVLGGLGFALQRTSATRATDHARAQKRTKLLDELVELEKAGKHDKRRAQITDELEALWDD